MSIKKKEAHLQAGGVVTQGVPHDATRSKQGDPVTLMAQQRAQGVNLRAKVWDGQSTAGKLGEEIRTLVSRRWVR